MLLWYSDEYIHLSVEIIDMELRGEIWTKGTNTHAPSTMNSRWLLGRKEDGTEKVFKWEMGPNQINIKCVKNEPVEKSEKEWFKM